jgi:hypothetical protein
MRTLRGAREVALAHAADARESQLLGTRMVATAAAEREVTPKAAAGQVPRSILKMAMELHALALRPERAR